MGPRFFRQLGFRAQLGFAAAILLAGCNLHIRISADPSTGFPTLVVSPTAEFNVSTQTVDESVGQVTVTVTKSHANDTTTTVPITISGTATAGVDYGTISGFVTVPAGATTGSISFTVTDDASTELNEQVILTLGAIDEVTDGAALGAQTTQTITITDNDPMVVSAYYANASDWNDYFVNNGASQLSADDTACTSAQTGSAWSCLHGGTLRKVTVISDADCTNVSARDSLGAFEWGCSYSSGILTFYSKGFKSGKSLRDLINSSGTGWAANSVIIAEGGTDNRQTVASTSWWGNPVTPLPPSTAAAETLNSAGTIYTLPSNAISMGYTIAADKIGVVTLGNSILSWDPTAPANCHSATNKCVLFSDSTNFLWIEGNYHARWSAEYGLRLTGVKWSRVNELSLVQTQRASLYTTDVSYTRFTNIKVAQSNNRCAYINNGSRLIFQGVRLSSCNLGGLIMDVSGYFNTLTDILVSGTQDWAGIYLAGAAGDGNVLSHMTVANGNFTAFGIRDVDNSNVSQLLSVNGGEEGMYIFSNAHNNRFANLALTHQFLWGISANTNNNVYTGVLALGGNGGDCNISGTNPGLTNTTCANAGTSSAILTTGLDLTTTLIGRISTDDSQNMSDTLGTIANNATLPFFDWLKFENPFRAWGIAGTNFPNAANWGRCSHGSACDIFDFSYKSTDTNLLGKSLDGQNPNTAFTVGSACPNAVDGNVTLTDTSSRTYLINAIEVADDGLGNDDGLCQSGEACVYSPNIGAYQGHGPLSSGTCNFTDGAVTGVKMYQWTLNGR